jgi:hypothetical protein
MGGFAVLMMFVSPVAANAQVTPAAGSPSSNDTPSIKIGAVIYADYTYTTTPLAADTDGNLVNVNQFNVGRAYLNVTGNVSHLVAFRITPDIVRETGAGSSLNGSLTFRLKYAFLQINLDDWMSGGSWTRLGIQQTPWVDFEEGIYRYRFQGTVFSEREGFLSSSDAGASFHYNVPSNYGDVHVGFYNGENYNRTEVNDQKALQVRGTARPFPGGAPLWRGLRAHVFYDADHYVKEADRERFISAVTFEHPSLNAGLQYLATHDQTSVTRADVESSGYSIWATPKFPRRFEGLLRYDHLKPNTALDAQERNRKILGIAYWFPHQGTVSSALLLDYDSATFEGVRPAQPRQTRIAVHGLVNF